MPTPEQVRDVFARYVAAVTAGDVETIVALYAPDARVEDPIGSAPHVGHEAIRAFYAASAGQVGLALEGAVRVAGHEAAAAMVARPHGAAIAIDTLDAMTFDEAGRITAMRAYWSAATIRPA